MSKTIRLGLIGGGGVRTPLLVHGLTHSDLPIRSIALYDPDAERLAAMASLTERLSAGVTIEPVSCSADAIRGADFVLTSIRPGGMAGRARDEAIALAANVLGQETVGPAGFAMALRTIPAMVGYAEEVATLAPDAWIINFTNPVGIVTQAVQARTRARIIGICDTPSELFANAARALGLPVAACQFDYVGLNHLGWLREVIHQGEPRLARLFAHTGALALALPTLYRAPLFEADALARLRLLPSEYLYYYYRPEVAVANLQHAGQTRGAALDALNAALFVDLARAASPDGALAVYTRYLATRDAGYLELESLGREGDPARPLHDPLAQVTGYDKIALAVIRAIHFGTGEVLALNVRNGVNVGGLLPDDVVEVPCAVDAGGPHPLLSGDPPDAARALLVEVKQYERLTVAAALEPRPGRVVDALWRHPLVGNRPLAAQLATALGLTQR